MPLAPSDHVPTVELWSAQNGWQAAPSAPIKAPRERWRVPVRVDGGAYATTDGVVAIVESDGDTATVRRIDAAAGRDMWRVPLPDVAMPATVAVSPGGSLVAVAGSSTTVVMDAADGRVLWRGKGLGGLPRVESVGDLILLDVPEGTAVIDRGTGAIRWQTPNFVEVSGTSLFVDDTNGYSVLDPATGTPLWTKPTGLDNDVDIIGDTLFVTEDLDGPSDSATAYDLATGEQRWQASVHDVGRGAVTPLDDDTVLVVGGANPAGNGFTVVTLSTGKVLWEAEGNATAMRVEGEPYVLTERGDRTEIRHGTTGKVVGTAPAPGDRSTLVAGGALYQTDYDKIRAYRLSELAGQWEVTLPNKVTGIRMPMPRGFVAEDVNGSAGHLVGYLD
jgi:outer membrane protein assembly factor BamB